MKRTTPVTLLPLILNVGHENMNSQDKQAIKVLARWLIARAVKALWFVLYTFPLCFLLWPYLAGIPLRFDLYLDRASLPMGMGAGLLWVLINAAICLLASVLAMIPVFFFIYWIWKLEEVIVLKWMSPKTRDLLDLIEYESPTKRFSAS